MEPGDNTDTFWSAEDFQVYVRRVCEQRPEPSPESPPQPGFPIRVSLVILREQLNRWGEPEMQIALQSSEDGPGWELPGTPLRPGAESGGQALSRALSLQGVWSGELGLQSLGGHWVGERYHELWLATESPEEIGRLSWLPVARRWSGQEAYIGSLIKQVSSLLAEEQRRGEDLGEVL